MDKPKWNKLRLIDGERWVQMIGEDVAICSNEKNSEKYIDFIRLTTFSNTGDKLFIDEDSPAVGGLSIGEAESFAAQLMLAVAILKEQTKGGDAQPNQ